MHKSIANVFQINHVWQDPGSRMGWVWGAPSGVIDRLRILWIFGFGHHKHHKGRGHNQEKSVQCLCQKSDIAASDASTLKSICEICFSRFIFNSTSLQIEVAHILNQWPCQGPTWNSLGRSANFQAVVRLISIFISSAWAHSLLPLPSRDLWVSLFQLPHPLTLGGCTGGNVGNC